MTANRSATDLFWDFYRDKSAIFLRFAASQFPPGDPADLVQNVFLEAAKRLSHDPDFLTYNWENWIKSMITFRAIDLWRKFNRSPVDLASKPTPNEDGTCDEDPIDKVSYEEDPLPSEIVEHREIIGLLRQAIDRMTDPNQRRIIELYDRDNNEPTLQDVANLLGIGLPLAKARHARAIKSLKRTMRSLISEFNSNDTSDHES